MHRIPLDFPSIIAGAFDPEAWRHLRHRVYAGALAQTKASKHGASSDVPSNWRFTSFKASAKGQKTHALQSPGEILEIRFARAKVLLDSGGISG